MDFLHAICLTNSVCKHVLKGDNTVKQVSIIIIKYLFIHLWSIFVHLYIMLTNIFGH